MLWRVVYKRFSPATEKFILVEADLETDYHTVTECGALVFGMHGAGGGPMITIPPTFWLLCEPADSPVTPGGKSLLVAP